MNNQFKKLAEEIKFEINGSFTKVVLDKARLVNGAVFNLDFKTEEIIKPSEMLTFLEHLNKNFRYKTRFKFDVTSVVFNIEEINEYLEMITGRFLNKPNLAKNIRGFKKNIQGSILKIETNGVIYNNKLVEVKKDIEKIMQNFGFDGFIMEISLIREKSNEIALEMQRAQIIAKEFLSRPIEKNEKVVVQKRNGYEKVSLSDLSEGMHSNVIVSGEIFKKTSTKTKTGLNIITLSISDFKEAVYLKMFARTPEQIEEQEFYKEGMFVEVNGNYQIDTFTREPTILVRKIRESEKSNILRKESLSNKRIELSARTKMSTMDGIISPSDLIKRADKWGHEAIAIIDQDSVQSFPEFYHASKNSNVKPIYGASFSTIDKNSQAIYWSKSKNLLEDSYVVFDLETTGLSPEYEDIIEFGATKVINGIIADTIQFFVKPTKSIPEIITKITSISDNDVKDAKPESEAILDIRDFLKGFTIVAHNANFDITFVNSKLVKYGYEEIKEPTIDSLVIARMTHPKQKKFRLENVAKRYSITYDTEVAHRADYDADVLARVWIRMIHDLKDMGIDNQEQLYNYKNDKLYARQFSKEVTCIAKNQDGLKELFRFISLGHTEEFFGSPKIFIEEFENRKNILLGSGALKSRLVDRMFYGSKLQVQEEIAKYDYIEVQPLKNFSHLINRGFEEKNIKDMIRFVVKEAKRQGKIVVATGDVRYLDKKDKIYHEVYINAKGLGGVRHYLYRFNEEDPVYPLQHILTTQEMMEEFSFLDDINLIKEIVVDNTRKISDMIEKIQVIKEDLYTPKFGNSEKQLTDLVYKNARRIYGEKLPKIIEDRIKRELTPIVKYGFAVIYWISHLLVGKSLNDGYLVGSRGSVGSSFVATMSEITEVNPLPPHYICSKCQYSDFPKTNLDSGFDLPMKKCPNDNEILQQNGQNIPFETFLGFEADKVPDIDLNFSGEYQSIIHNEVKNLFGEKHAFRAGTISTVAEKTAFGYVKSWAEETNKNLSKPFIEFIAKGVAGTKRTTGQHPGGIIVIPGDYSVEDFSPINFPANDISASWKTTHFDFHAIHDNVLKLDLLGHDDPTAIKYLEELTGIDAKKDIPFHDEKIISLFSSPEALGITSDKIGGEKTGAMGIPEFGTKFVRGMLKNAKVSSFGDLVSVSGLSHGTDVWANNAELLVRNHGHSLKEVISCRDDIMTDLLAKGIEPMIAFNIMEKVRKGKGVTTNEAKIMKDNGVEDWYIDSLNKIKYMFPKAHATAYVMMAWRIAWFKLYYPLAYYATYFTTRSDVFDIETVIKGEAAIRKKLSNFESRRYKYGPDKLSNKESDLIPIFELSLEAISRGITISNIDLDKSQAKKWIFDKESNKLIPPFTSLDGLGDAVAHSIIEAREKLEFTSIEDLKKRTSINKTHIEILIEMGVISHLSETNQISLF
ncbi:MAG: PolC-type DNA polymerase III [Mycoplasmatales bacterium]|nr:PolC-type DNA polymerase III [Mycoplasmatales bacterium]